MLEDEVEQRIKLESPKMNVVLLRNNSGAFTDETGRTVRYGLGHISKKQNEILKSSDEIGITELFITPEMVGKTVGVFTAIEVKKQGWNPKNLNAREIAQKNFIDFVISKGGVAGFADSVEKFREIIGTFKKLLRK